MNTDTYNDISSAGEQVNFFSTLLLRDALLSNLLQTDYNGIAYWAGKELARQFPLDTIDSVITFFKNAGFGNLEIIRQNSAGQVWRLRGSLVKQRLRINRQADFNLETGFLAQQLESQTHAISEGSYQIKGKIRGVTINLLSDSNNSLQSDNPSEQMAMRDDFLKASQDFTDVDEEVGQSAAPTQSVNQSESITTNRSTTPSSTEQRLIDQSITNSLLAFQFDSTSSSQ